MSNRTEDELFKKAEWGIYDKTTRPGGFDNDALDQLTGTVIKLKHIFAPLRGYTEANLLYLASRLDGMEGFEKVGEMLRRLVEVAGRK